MSLEDYTSSRGITNINAIEENHIASGDTNPRITVGGQRAQSAVVLLLCRASSVVQIYGVPKDLSSYD